MRAANDRKLAICGRALMFEGGVLLVVAAIHLLVIPILSRELSRGLTVADFATIWPPFLLNHVVVGILLIPLGVSTVYAGHAVAQHLRWGFRIACLNAVTVLSLPAVLFAVMPLHYFHAPPFLVASVLVCLAALSMISLLVWVRAEFRDGVTG